ncbi:MAG: serine hydrolase domain-containing protein, partial [Burkholderiales bacterium]
VPRNLFLGFLALASTAFGADLGRGKPEDVGLSSQRLGRIQEVLGAKVKAGEIPGYVALVARRGKVVYYEANGVQDPNAKTPMARDSIFRIFSMTKPVTSVAAMMLVEEGKMKLGDPVSMYLPELANLQVATNADTAKTPAELQTRPAKNPVRVLDLFLHTAGFTYGFFKGVPGGGPVEQMYLDGNVLDNNITNAEFLARISKQPLKYEPGTTWWYSQSTDVLGRLVEVVSGMTLGEFIDKRIAQPLGMADTSFRVGPNKVARLAQPFDEDRKGLILQYTEPTKGEKFEAGGHGLTGTVMDYARFAQMLLNGGSLGNAQILGKKTVELMTSNHIVPGIGHGPFWLPGQSHGYGLLGAVRTEGPRAPAFLNPMDGSDGEYFWAGYAGTYFWVDPKEELVGVYMMQSVKHLLWYANTFKTLVSQSVVK